MKRVQKGLALVLALALCGSLLAGCGGADCSEFTLELDFSYGADISVYGPDRAAEAGGRGGFVYAAAGAAAEPLHAAVSAGAPICTYTIAT